MPILNSVSPQSISATGVCELCAEQEQALRLGYIICVGFIHLPDAKHRIASNIIMKARGRLAAFKTELILKHFIAKYDEFVILASVQRHKTDYHDAHRS